MYDDAMISVSSVSSVSSVPLWWTLTSPGLLENVAGKCFAPRPQSQIISGFVIKPAPIIAVEDCPPNYPVDHFGPEIVAAVKVLDRIHDLLPAEPWVLVVGELMSQFIRHV